MLQRAKNSSKTLLDINHHTNQTPKSGWYATAIQQNFIKGVDMLSVKGRTILLGLLHLVHFKFPYSVVRNGIGYHDGFLRLVYMWNGIQHVFNLSLDSKE